MANGWSDEDLRLFKDIGLFAESEIWNFGIAEIYGREFSWNESSWASIFILAVSEVYRSYQAHVQVVQTHCLLPLMSWPSVSCPDSSQSLFAVSAAWPVLPSPTSPCTLWPRAFPNQTWSSRGISSIQCFRENVDELSGRVREPFDNFQPFCGNLPSSVANGFHSVWVFHDLVMFWTTNCIIEAFSK